MIREGYIILVLVFMQMGCLMSQTSIKTGWVNSVSAGVGLNNIFDGHGAFQLEYLLYKQSSSNHGVGGGITLTIHEGLGGHHNDIGTHAFADIFFYAKAYFNEDRRKGFVDIKLGYAVGLNTQEYYCDDCRDGIITYSYPSDKMVQVGVGNEYRLTDETKWGIKFSLQVLSETAGALICSSSLYF